ncbi:unnamed protein product [Ectocarpus sp. CCAP 1310/34]|nr:unnamed protein product [Ectocarpus sp. CCAP 1310/34]
MASEEDKSNAPNGGGAPVLDTSWIDDSAVVAVAYGGDSGGVTRGRGGGKRRTRRRTLSPSIGKHNYMSNVDLNDPMKYPSLPSSGGDDGGSSNHQKSRSPSSHDQEFGGGLAEVTILRPPPQRDTDAAVTSPGADSAAAISVPASPSGSTASPDTDLPDPTAVADLFEAEEGTTLASRPSPLGTLNNNETKPSSSSAPKKKSEGKQDPLGQASSAAVARGRRSRRATFGGADARIRLEAENLAPVLPSKPPNPVPAARAPTATRSPRTMDGEVVGAVEEQASGLSTAIAAAATRPGDGEETQKRVPPPPPLAAATKKSRSRSSRRRSIVMPCEAQPLMDSDLGEDHAEAETPNMPPPPPAPPATGGDGTATAAATPADGDGKPSQGSTSTTNSPADELPLSSINVVSCLSRPLAAQRGWPVGDEDTRKRLFRAFYGAAPGSQRARRVAARLFCLTGYALSAVAPEDARVLCEAAGDSMEWGLEGDEPRLVSQPVRRESKEQKRGLVLRIKVGDPLFDLMDKASKDEKLKAESATGVVSRKAAPDGFCYEDRETGEPVEPGAYKVPYLRHVRDVRASRVREFAAARRVVVAASAAAAAAAASSSACRETAVDGMMPGVEKRASSSVKGTAISVACISPTRAEAASKSRRNGEGLVADPATDAFAAASRVTVGELAAAKESLPPGAASWGVDNNGDTPSKKIDGGGAVVAIGEGEARDDVSGGEEADVLTITEGTTQEASPEAAAETPRTVTSGERLYVGVTAAVAKNAAAIETLVSSNEAAVVDGAGEEKAMAEALVRGEVQEVEDLEVWKDMTAPVVAGGGVETIRESAAGEVNLDSSPSSHGTPEAVVPHPLSARLREPHGDSGLETAAIHPPFSHGVPETHGVFVPEESSASRVPETSTPRVLATHGVVSPTTTSSVNAGSSGDEQGRDGAPLAACGNRVDSISERVEEAVSAYSPRRGGQTPMISATANPTSRNGGGSSVRVLGPPSSPPGSGGASSPFVEQGQHEESLGGGTPGPGGTAWKASHFGVGSPFSAAAYGAGAPTVPPAGGVAVSPGQDDEGAEEIAALEERLWAVVDAALREYHDGVALVRSRRNHHAFATAGAASETEENSTALSCVPDAGAAATPPPAAQVGETAASRTSSGLGLEEEAYASGLPAKAAPVDTTPLTGDVDRTRAVAAPAAATVEHDGQPTPDSPLLPLLQLRLSEEEDDERFEYSLAWGGAGAEAGGGGSGGGSSKARGGKPRRRSLAKAFSSHKTRKEPKVHEGAGARSAAQVAGIESEARGDGVGGGKTTRLTCRLCCRNACDTVMKPCQHSACSVCVDKLRSQGEQSGQALSCPWDRRGVDEICPLQENP